MEQIFFVKNGELAEVNKYLKKGGKVRDIHVVSENISAYACGGEDSKFSDYGSYAGNIYAYVVIEFD